MQNVWYTASMSFSKEELKQLDEIALKLYGKTHSQLQKAGYVWSKCVDIVEKILGLRKTT